MKTEEYAQNNKMKLNYKKTKLMLFHPCWSVDFMPELELDNNQLEMVEEMRLLGLIIQSDMKWTANTDHIVTKAFSRIWILRRLKGMGAKTGNLLICI